VVSPPVATFRLSSDLRQVRNALLLGVLLSGWRDLNSRPLDPQIGPCRSLSANDLSLGSIVDGGHALSLVGLVRSWSVVRTAFSRAAQVSFAIPVSLSAAATIRVPARTVVRVGSQVAAPKRWCATPDFV
jgi:hypothetical protein